MDNSTLPNPDTYLNHLQPAAANEFEIVRNFYLAILGAAIWDVLVYIPEDVKIILNNFGVVTICFAFARIFAIVYVFLFVIVTTLPISNCREITLANGIVCLTAMACTTFLVLKRLHAVYPDQRFVRWTFNFLGFAATAMDTTVLFGMSPSHIKGTGYCTIYHVAEYTAVNEFMPAVFYTLVFIAVSYKLISDFAITNSSNDHTPGWTSFFTGDSLPRICRVMLRGGQQHYAIVFIMTIVYGVVLYTPSVPATYRSLPRLAQSTLATSMACRVYRNLKKIGQVDYVESRVSEARFGKPFAEHSSDLSSVA